MNDEQKVVYAPVLPDGYAFTIKRVAKTKYHYQTSKYLWLFTRSKRVETTILDPDVVDITVTYRGKEVKSWRKYVQEGVYGYDQETISREVKSVVNEHVTYNTRLRARHAFAESLVGTYPPKAVIG